MKDLKPSSFFRVRFLLEARRPIKLSAHQGPVVYALMAHAYGLARREEPFIPDGLMPDSPEQCRLRLEPGQRYALGYTSIHDEPEEAAQIARTMTDGLDKAGREKSQRGPAATLRGNYRLLEVRNLVTGEALTDAQCLSAISWEQIETQQRQVRRTQRLTLRFTSPLRMPRRAADRRDGHNWFDEQSFDASLFALRMINRLTVVGLARKPSDIGAIYRRCRTIENRLVWLDLGYGPRSRRKTLGGAVGRVQIDCHDTTVKDALVLGQYARIGQCTRFGFGTYQIEECRQTSPACARGMPLLDSIFQPRDHSLFAEELDIPSGAMKRSIKLLISGDYKPHGHTRVPIEKPDGTTRVLSIPAPLDRALQRAVLTRLAPALDQFFEESSLAYRQGLGRKRAAVRIRNAFRDGYRYALRCDFRQFFDSIDHRLLNDRLEAYLADSPTVEALMRWVRAGSPYQGRGLPTGAPISPLLANLFLDRFDEQVTREGGRLVRYADDFMILFKDTAKAQQVFDDAQSSANALLLSLNSDKTRHVKLRSGFEFLGFRFQKTDRWVVTSAQTPQRVEDLGWRQAIKRPTEPTAIPLPGETDLATPENRSWAIFGPGATALRQHKGLFSCSYRHAAMQTTVPADQTREILILGHTTVTASALRACQERRIRLILADDSGRPRGELAAEVIDTPPEAVAAQLSNIADLTWRLAIARRLIAAKILNYATLARVISGVGDAPPNPALHGLIRKANTARSFSATARLRGSRGPSLVSFLCHPITSVVPIRAPRRPRCRGPRQHSSQHRSNRLAPAGCLGGTHGRAPPVRGDPPRTTSRPRRPGQRPPGTFSPPHGTAPCCRSCQHLSPPTSARPKTARSAPASTPMPPDGLWPPFMPCSLNPVSPTRKPQPIHTSRTCTTRPATCGVTCSIATSCSCLLPTPSPPNPRTPHNPRRLHSPRYHRSHRHASNDETTAIRSHHPPMRNRHEPLLRRIRHRLQRSSQTSRRRVMPLWPARPDVGLRIAP